MRCRRTLQLRREDAGGWWSTTPRRRDGSLVGVRCSVFVVVSDELGVWVLEVIVFSPEVVILGDAASPALTPIPDQGVEDPTIELQ